jgi:alkaline phosphatase D
MKNIILILFLVISSYLNQAVSQQSLLKSGPMVGYADMQEVVIWVQTNDDAEVFVEYSGIDSGDKKVRTNIAKTNKTEAFTAKLIADSVVPGTKYIYNLFINNELIKLPYKTEFQTQAIWKYRGNPPEFRLLTGSCAYINQAEHDRPGTPYGGNYEIFESMRAKEADLMVWLGDNIYLREPDWNTKTGIFARYTHSRSVSELQPFLASTANYAIRDDHDFGPNDSDRGFYNKNISLEAFKLFFANPTVGVGDLEGSFTSFQWGDADFFLLDNRTYRDPDNLITENKTMLGEKQLQWLFDNLVTSQATFKIVAVGGQFLSTSGKFESYYSNGYQSERQAIIDFIYKQNIKNVVFLTGDVHFTEISALKVEGKPTIWDLTFSPITAGPNTQGTTWNNTLRIPGTVVTERNYGMIDFKGILKERRLEVKCFNSADEQKWEYIINQE